MDRANPELILTPKRERVLHEKRRDTISVPKRDKTSRDDAWHGAAPRPLPEAERNWRPRDFHF